MSVQLSAAQAVAEHFQSPDDLQKLEAFRQKLEKEKASIDAKLKSGVKEQLDATRDGLRKLISTRSDLQGVKDEMISMDKMGKDSIGQIKTFDQIAEVSRVHRNFAQTEEMVNNLLDMDDKLGNLEYMLDADSRDPQGPNEHLLELHYQLNQLEAFRNETMHMAKSATPQTRSTLTQYFSRLNRLSTAFDAHIIVLAKNILPLVRAGYTNVVVKLLKIAEMEGREDEKAMAIRLLKKAAKMDAASKFRSLQANARILKHYRSSIMTAIRESIREGYESRLRDAEGNTIQFIESLDEWLFDDLSWIEIYVAPCFPPDYEVYAMYVKTYHKELDHVFKQIRESLPPASVLLAMHAWVKTYKKKMKEIEIPDEYLEPPLMGGKEQSLIDDYSRLIVQKLEEWTGNLMQQELSDFTTREAPPQTDPDGLYGMSGPVILWKIINEQVDAATESNQGAVLARIVTESNRVIKSTQAQWSKLVDSELKKSVEGKPEEIAPGLSEFVVALANDQIRSADFAEELSARLEPLVSTKYKATIADQLNEVIDGYLDVAKKCVQTLIELIFHDLKPAVKQLFTAPWYDGIMPQIVETLRDYMTDFQATLNPSLLDLMIEDLLDMFIITYLSALARSSKLRMPAARNRIKDDVADSFEFFSTLKDPRELEANFEVVERSLEILSASRSLVFLSFYRFAQQYGPNLAYVESLIRARDDFDRAAANEVMESIKKKVRDENITDRTCSLASVPTIS
ncbi:SubName: Full=Related to SEC6-protein transport protein {ECO:0000313/EMBL:CCA72681.1} [Serendipita indica DSM 11827]|nr:SubName: Full=Related to SEC6-protein transport protein {ECO:0000313/EMBL:CCA72681.1} [Serendipita indica DSM 11827]